MTQGGASMHDPGGIDAPVAEGNPIEVVNGLDNIISCI